MKLSKGIQFFAGSTQTTYDLTNLNLSAGNYAITVVAEAEGFTDSDASNSVNYTVQAQLAAPTIAMNADGKTLEITDVADATSYDVYVDGTLKTNVARPAGYTILVKNYTTEAIDVWVNKPNTERVEVSANTSRTFNDVITMQFYTYGNYIMSYETTAGTPGSGTFTDAIFVTCTFNQSGEVTISKGEHV